MIIDMLTFVQESSKVLHMDASHSALRDKLQTHLSAEHRVANPEDTYYNHPYVRDVYGDNESGQVVYSKGGKHSMAAYKHADGKVTFSGHKSVKPAYVQVDASQKEAVSDPVFYVDGESTTLAAKEAVDFDLESDVLELKEAAFNSQGIGLVKLIAPGHGATGYYSPDVLKDAAARKVFSKTTQMHLDHQTESEEAARPEGSVKTLAASFTEDADYRENGPDGPGLYAPIKAVADMKDFLNNRASIMGASIRALGRGKMGVVGGRMNRIVEQLVHGKSVDFVTRAGAGGKLVSLYESYRQQAGQNPADEAAKERERMKIEIEELELTRLKESAAKVPTLELRLDRSNERMNLQEARTIVADALAATALPKVSQTRVGKMLLAGELPVIKESGVLDVTALAAKVAVAVTDETTYLKESGVVFTGVRGLGGDGLPVPSGEQKTFDATLKESQAQYDADMELLTGIKAKEKAA